MKKKIDLKLYPISVYIYFFLPFLLFSFFWMKSYIAIPVILILILCLFRMCKKPGIHAQIFWNKQDKKKILLIIGIICFWVGISGVGGFSYQTDDHLWRNAIFETLVYEDWPVVSEQNIDGILTRRGFSYYMGFWMPAASVAKVFGIQVGYFAQVVWAVIGIFLFYYGVCLLKKKIVVWPLIVFIFFSGMDIVGYYITGVDINALSPQEHIEWWTSFQYSSMTTQLFWVFNQCIPAWILTVLLLLENSNKYIAILLALSMTNCTLPFVGVLPLAIYLIFSRRYSQCNNKWNVWLKDTFTLENILGGAVVGIISLLFLMKTGSGSDISLIDFSNGGWMVYVVFLLVEIGGICFSIFSYHKNNPIFHIALIWLLICPMLNMYGGDNFCMRASIPALLMLYLCVVYALEEAFKLKNYMRLISIVIVLCIGAVTPCHEIVRSIAQTEYKHKAGENVRVESVGIDAVMQNDYESCNADRNYFYKYIAK